MNMSTSQCSSGCESGWTLYLDQSSVSGNECRRAGRVLDEDDCGRKNAELGQQDEEEDLSMVSDASSGPPHFDKDDEDCYDENGCFCSTSMAAKKSQKKKIKETCTKQQHSSLDDTASSPVLSSSKKKFSLAGDQAASMEHGLDFSQGFSATHYKGKSKSAFQKRHIDFLTSSLASKPSSDKPGSCEGRREWE